MARKSLPSKDKSHNGLSADEFQKQLLNWFQDRGLLSDLQAHLRHQMIVALRDTSLDIHSAGAFHQAGSPKLQAINLLVAEFLLRQQCHYTLSVFTSEVPLLRNLPEFSTAVSNSTSGGVEPHDGFPGFHERDVFDILEALGYASNSEESKTINDLYEHSQGESLLTSLIRSLPNTTSSYHASEKAKSVTESQEPKTVEEQHAALQQSPLFTEDIRTIIQQSTLRADQITQMHNAVKRIIEEEVEKTKKKEENKFHQELIDREQRIQLVWSQHDIEMQEMQKKSEEILNEERLKLKEELNRKQDHFAALAAQLQDQQHTVASQLEYIQERSNLIERKEVEIKVLRKDSEEYLRKRQGELNAKERHLEDQLTRLETETKAREQEKKELQANRLQIEEASRAIKESQSEIALLRELQKEHHLQLRAEQERLASPNKTEVSKKKPDTPVKKRHPEFCTQGTQADISKPKGAVPKKHNAHQQTAKISRESRSLQTQISASDLEDIFLQLNQQNAETERQRSQHAMFSNLVDQLQQENLELRGHIEQQRLRIQELTDQASDYMHQLRQAHNTVTRLRTQHHPVDQSHHGVQTTPRSSPDRQAIPMPAAAAVISPSLVPVMDSVPGLALGAYGYHTPPPAPPQPRPMPETRPPVRGFVRSSQVGAGEESYFSRRLPPESFVPLYTSPNHREQRRKPPRRLMVHSVSSSDESCPSPTEEMLREARRRLRRLEEETAAIDRSYQEFRLRHADSLTNTASILFQPLTLSREYSTNFTLSTTQNLPTRNVAQNPPVFSFPTFNRNRPFTSRGLINQFQSTTALQPGALQPFSIFPVQRTNEQAARQSFSFTSSQTQSSPPVTPLYSVPTEVFSARPPSAQGGTVTTSIMHAPLSSVRVQNDASVIGRTRGDLRLPAGFTLRGQSRYSGERESFQSVDNHQQNRSSSRWQQELPSFTSSVPHMSILTVENERVMNGSKTRCVSEKPVVFLHQDSQKQPNSSREFIEHPLNPVIDTDSQPFELMKDISLRSASEENIGERLLSPPLRVSISEEHDRESQLHSTKSCTELDESDNQHQTYQNAQLKQSVSPHSVDASIHSKSENDLIIEKAQPTNSNHCDIHEDKIILQTSITKAKSTSEDSTKPSEEDKEKHDYFSEVGDIEQGQVLNISREPKVLSESPAVEENNLPHNSFRKPETDLKVSEVSESRQEANTDGLQRRVEEQEESQTDSDAARIKCSPEKESIKSASETKHVTSKELLPDKNSEISPADVKEQSKISDVHNENSSEQHSKSSSLPSTLGSSNELSSDIISAGEVKSDDSW